MEALTNGDVSGAGHVDTPKDSTEGQDMVKAFKNNSDLTESKKESSGESTTNDNESSPAVEQQSDGETSKAKENGISDASKLDNEVQSCSPGVDRTDESKPINNELKSGSEQCPEESSSKEEGAIKGKEQSSCREECTIEKVKDDEQEISTSSNTTADKNCDEVPSPKIEPPVDSQNDQQESSVGDLEKECHENNKLQNPIPPSSEKSDLPLTSSTICEKVEEMDCSNDKADSEDNCNTTDDKNVDSESKLDSSPMEIDDKTDVSIAKGQLIAGESIVISEDDASNSNHSSKSPDDSQVIENSNENSNADEPMDVDEQPVTTKKTKKSLENKSSPPLDEDSKTPQGNNESEASPCVKSEEHIVSDNDSQSDTVPNDTKKVPSSNGPSPPSPVALSTDLNSNNEKENKDTDSPVQETPVKESADAFVFAELSNEETGFPDAFTGHVKIGKYISVKGDFTLRSSEALVESPSLVAPYLLKEPDSFPSKERDPNKTEVKDFFHSSAGEVLIGIGLSRVTEWFHKDMVRIKQRQMKKGGKTPELEQDMALHEKYYSETRNANKLFSFEIKECKTCKFLTDSSIVMEGHLLIPHLTQRREHQCNFCEVIKKDGKEIIEHMKEMHNKIGRIEPPVPMFECIYCAFESNSKVKINNHLIKCQRVFDQALTQAPNKDYELPALTPKPITVAVVKAYEKSLGSMQKGRGRPKKELSMDQSPHMPLYRNTTGTPLADSLMQNHMMSQMLRAAGQLRPGMPMPSNNRFMGQMMPMMGNNLNTSPQFPFDNKKPSSNSQLYSKLLEASQRQQNSKGAPSLTITPLPKLTGPYPVPMSRPSTSAAGNNNVAPNSQGLVVCEICDGYIKDLEALRTHMQLIHKVKIHPKMLVSRPPLNCQKCQWRFFTDQGLERHLLGAHGLVTSNMQEMANKGKDAGCCTICGRVYASKLVSHMNQVHKISLKPAHLSYKCTVCSATFNLYRLFENHVYLVHSSNKRSAEGRASPSAKKLKSESEEAANHKEKKPAKEEKEVEGDENAKKCKECGADLSKDDTCKKCLKPEEEDSVSAKTKNNELSQNEKVVEKAAV